MNYSFMVSRIDSKGISKADKKENTSQILEKDRYDSTTLSSRIGYEPFANLQLGSF